ncbi:MAG: DEAD/DEAH box helicase [Gammaproteobacteria bacterium]|nr:DEAD/DEAH box helicase [Gammaproteobacteria bacterium]MYF37928.1 DEAD/DEAH box helicase [Gammaproteobacteria bacterium]
MARRTSSKAKSHTFRDKLILNQWLISRFGIAQPWETTNRTQSQRPFHILVEKIKNCPEGMESDNLHYFYHELKESNFFRSGRSAIDVSQILTYEENIVRHTSIVNSKRTRPITWKYFQWLALLFVEIYLDQYFLNRKRLLQKLNEFVEQFNSAFADYESAPAYTEDDLNKICLQNATGSGKTLLMHVNVLQYRQYSERQKMDKNLSRIILLTPNERLSRQHVAEFRASDISAGIYLESRGDIFDSESGLEHIDVLEITKLGDEEKEKTIATRSLGDQNLLLVDEGHRGLSGKDEGAWFSRRSELCAKGFTFEYSATFEQAVKASGSSDTVDSYAKSVIFDYSYRWFYEDGFGKDYLILNLPKSAKEVQRIYLTACLLKFYQQLRIYEERASELHPFNLEKPLWIFVGNTVSKVGQSKDTITDVAIVVRFIANFIEGSDVAISHIRSILKGTGQDTGLVDEENNDVFEGAFRYLVRALDRGETVNTMYQDIISRLFNSVASGGHLVLSRIKGDSGEILLGVSGQETPFGLISVGDAKGLCDHIVESATKDGSTLKVEDSEFKKIVFASLSNSSSPINLLIGSKKFVEGWDCWRVSTMGLMHVGRSEGAQIVQLFGRGVRLKGYEWSLKRSGRVGVHNTPEHIEDLETLNVFGVGAKFMERFRNYLEDEGLPGNERFKRFKIPLNVTYDFGKPLSVLRPKRKTQDGREYDFHLDGSAISLGQDIEFFTYRGNKIIVDWYPRINVISSQESRSTMEREEVSLLEDHLALLDYDDLYFELEEYKIEKGWYNYNVTKHRVQSLLENPSWYSLYLPKTHLRLSRVSDIELVQRVVLELLKRYCEKHYNYRKRLFFETRLELRELSPDDTNFPEGNSYVLSVAETENPVIKDIRTIQKQLKENRGTFLQTNSLKACNFDHHLYEPLLHVQRGRKITVQPVSLNESEYKFVQDLKHWYDSHVLHTNEIEELFLLRNMSRGRGIGFFEAGNFHPDFIMWLLGEDKQYVSFVEPHGLGREGPGSDKVQFYTRIKDIEQRLGGPKIYLNSFILSWTKYEHLSAAWDRMDKETIEELHILFMHDGWENYIPKLFRKIRITDQ